MHTMMIKVDNVVQRTKSHGDENHGINNAPISPLKSLPISITKTLLERNWRNIFAGVAVIDIVYIDDSLVIFDINFLARVRGTRICARREPDFF